MRLLPAAAAAQLDTWAFCEGTPAAAQLETATAKRSSAERQSSQNAVVAGLSAHSSRLRPAIPPLEIVFEPSWEEEREGGREGRRKEEMGREPSSLVVPDPSVDVLRSICCDDLLLSYYLASY